MIVKLHPDAEVDVNEAQQWYAQRSAIAARAFLTEFITAVDRILQLPGLPPLPGRNSALFFAHFPV